MDIQKENLVKLSEFIGKPLFATNDALIGGVIKNVGFDKHLRFAKCLTIDTQNPNDLQTKYVYFRDIVDFQYDAIVIKYSENIHPSWDYYNKVYCPFEKKVFNQNGKYIGILTEIKLDKARVCGIEIDHQEFDYNLIYSISDTAVCINDSGKKIISRPTSNLLKNKIKKINLPKVRIAKTKSIKSLQSERNSSVFLVAENQPLLNIENDTPNATYISNINNIVDTISTIEFENDETPREINADISINDTIVVDDNDSLTSTPNQNIAQQDNLQTNDFVENLADTNHLPVNDNIKKNIGKQQFKSTSTILNTQSHKIPPIINQNNATNTPTMPVQIDSLHTEVTKTPPDRHSYDKYYFIKNKLLIQDIFDHYGNKIFKKGTLITDEVIDIAKVHNRLVHLVLYSN